MKTLHALILSLILVTSSFAFDGNEKHIITVNRGFFSTTYTLDGSQADLDEIEVALPYVPEAYNEWKAGNIMRYSSWGLAFAGGFCLGYGIVDSQNNDARDEATISGARGVMILGGGGAIIAAIIIEHVGNSKKDHAIKIFNSLSGGSNSAGKEKPSFSIDLTPTEQGGIGLAFNF